MSDSRIRAMLAEPEKTPADRRLPPADGTDASDRPWWWASTVDRWCRRTGRPVPADADALYRWPTADGPAPVVHAGDVRVPTRGLAPEVPVHVTVYDTAEGHIVWVQRYDESGGVDREEAARAGALVLAPTWWTRARILVPGPLLLGGRLGAVPAIDAFRIEVPDRGLDRPAGPPRWLPSFVRSGAAAEPDPLDVEIVHAGLPQVDEVARVVGRALPLWFADSCTRENMDRAELLGPGRRFTVPDTSTDWPAHRARIIAAHEWGLPRRFPRAWTALSADTLEVLDAVLQTLQATVTEGDGWYAPARPAEPDWPVAVETAARRAAASTEAARTARSATRADLGVYRPDKLDPAEELDTAAEELDAGAVELAGIRTVEADLRWDDPDAVALWAAARSLEARLHRTHPEVVYETVRQQVIEGDGQVAQAYRATLTPLEPAAQQELREAPTRRLLRLLSPDTDVETVRKYQTLQRALAETTQLYHDPKGRLVAERTIASRRAERVQLQIEWPTGHPPQDWTADTVLAGEDNVFALTPTPAGELRVEPLPSSSGDTDYTWGYSGGGPTDLYRALVRGALRTWEDPAPWIRRSLRDGHSSALWEAITTAGQTQPLRLAWPQVQAWAAADLEANPPDLELRITRTDGEIDSVQLLASSAGDLLQLERRLADVGIVSDRLYADSDYGQQPDILFGLDLRPADAKTISDVLDADHLRFQRTDEDAEVT
jgi:hypothetical protein